jgi:hypothetical protein
MGKRKAVKTDKVQKETPQPPAEAPKDTTPPPAETQVADRPSEPSPPTKKVKKGDVQEEILKEWLNKHQSRGADVCTAEVSLKDHRLADEFVRAANSLWEEDSMHNLFMDIWNGTYNNFGVNMSASSMLVDMLVRAIKEYRIREDLVQRCKTHGHPKEALWKTAGERLWNVWTEELKFLHI